MGGVKKHYFLAGKGVFLNNAFILQRHLPASERHDLCF